MQYNDIRWKKEYSLEGAEVEARVPAARTEEIEALLQDYQWEFNTPYLRDLIKAKADTICEKVKNNGGIQEYLNVCDESNNTDDVIDNEMFVLSTSIEPGRACGKMVQELTIYKSGALQALIK